MSNVVKIEQLREKRAKLHTEMGEILERADSEGMLKAEDAAEYDKREAEFDVVTLQVGRLEKYDGIDAISQRKATGGDADGDERRGDGGDQGDTGGFRRKKPDNPFEKREYAEAFDAYLHGEIVDPEVRAAMQVGTASEGGYTVADEWYRRLIESEREFGIMLQKATIIRTADSGQLKIPKVATSGTAALTAEEAAYTESEDTFGQAVMDSYKIGTLIKISDELLHDSMFDLGAFIARRAGQAIGIKANTYMVTGTGSAQPNGITVAATVGKTAAATGAITSDELIDLFHSLLSPYRNRADFMLKDSTAAAIRKLKDGNSQYLWQPGLQAGQPDVLLGRPVYTDPDMPALGASAITVVFGVLEEYWVREVGTATVKVLNELYAVNGQVGYRVDRRLDGELIDTAAVRTLQQAA